MVGTVVITGVAQGLGRAMAEQFIALGHQILGCDVDAAVLSQLQQQFGPAHSFTAVDVADDAQVSTWVQQWSSSRTPDLLINNAGVMHPLAALWEVPVDVCDRVLDVNVKGTINVLRHALPTMVARNHGIIVNISARWGRVGARQAAPFCASKWAIEGLTQSLAQELPAGMAAVTLNPGAVNTQALATIHGNAKAAEYPDPGAWALQAVPYLLAITPAMTGQALSL